MNQSIEERLKVIEQRNLRVETDKAWETSLTRRLALAALTYVVVVIYLLVIGNNSPFKNAIVPPIGFLLSTLVMRRIRVLWQAAKRKRY